MMGRYVFNLDELGLEIATIALPAALALTADPIASLIDTAFIGQLGTYFVKALPSRISSNSDLLLFCCLVFFLRSACCLVTIAQFDSNI